jgi:hypothetical protein
MAAENDQLETLTPEQEAQAEAEFMAAFNTTREQTMPHVEGSTDTTNNADRHAAESNGQDGHEDDAAARAQAEADAAAAQAAADAAAQAQAQAEANAPVALTKAEVEALRAAAATIPQLQEELRRTRDTTAGKIGSIQQELKAIAARAADGQKPALAQLKRLRAEFPELGQMLEEDLADAFATPAAANPDPQGNAGDAPAPQADPVMVDPLADERVQQVLKQKEQAIVDAVHPDWRDLRKTPEFSEWRSQLPQAAQDLLASSWDAKVLVDAFKGFKDWKHKRDEQAAAQADANKQRGKRLENAIPATRGSTTGINAVDDDAAFEAGFKAVRTGSR